jgi:uncharacterized membrane protein YjjP (DUF1212 family)
MSSADKTLIPPARGRGASDFSCNPGTEDNRLNLYLELGKLLYESGATVHRTIDSVKFCAQIFGDVDVHVLISYEFVQINMRTGNKTYVQSINVVPPFRINAAALHNTSRMLAALESNITSPEFVLAQLKLIASQPPVTPKLITIIFVGLACSAFALMNHADLNSLWFVAVATSLGYYTKLTTLAKSGSLYLAVLLSTLVTAGSAGLLLTLFGSTTPEVTIIASVLYLVPGSILILGGLDVLRNHTLSGIARITSFAVQMLIVTGVLLIPLFYISHVINTPAQTMSVWLGIISAILASGIATLGFAFMMNVPKSALLWTILIGCTARTILEIAAFNQVDPIISVFIAMISATLLAFLVSRITLITEVVIAVVVAIPMVPGIASINGIKGLFQLAQHSGAPDLQLIQTTLHNSLFALFVALALIASIIFPIIILTQGKPRI